MKWLKLSWGDLGQLFFLKSLYNWINRSLTFPLKYSLWIILLERFLRLIPLQYASSTAIFDELYMGEELPLAKSSVYTRALFQCKYIKDGCQWHILPSIHVNGVSYSTDSVSALGVGALKKFDVIIINHKVEQRKITRHFSLWDCFLWYNGWFFYRVWKLEEKIECVSKHHAVSLILSIHLRTFWLVSSLQHLKVCSGV